MFLPLIRRLACYGTSTISWEILIEKKKEVFYYFGFSSFESEHSTSFLKSASLTPFSVLKWYFVLK